MKITVLADNNSLIDRYFLAEPALSFYIEADGKKILFDAGYSDVFLKNAARLGIDLGGLDYIIISHGHLDHTWGLKHLFKFYKNAKKKPLLIAHPDLFLPKFFDGVEIGLKEDSQTLLKYFDICPSVVPLKITKNLFYLGEIPRKNDFEGAAIQGDLLLDDTALAFKGKYGLDIVTGCSHAGIVNIINYAKKVTKVKKVAAVIGGLHLMSPDDNVIKKTTDYLKKQKLKVLYPCHCVDLASKVALSNATHAVKETGAGMTMVFN